MKHIWKYLTMAAAMFFALNPELFELAIVINVIGFETFLLLVQIQIVLLLKSFIFNSVFKSISEFSIQTKDMILIQSPQAILMQMLVITAMIGIIVNV